jgi:hypothetical protein
MKYTWTSTSLTLEEANAMLSLLWTTTDDSRIHESNQEPFVKDRIELYSHLGKQTKISLQVDFV